MTTKTARLVIRRGIGGVVAAVVALGVVTASASPASAEGIEISDLDSGTFGDQLWIQLQLQNPFPAPSDPRPAGAAFSIRTPDGVHLTGLTQNVGGAPRTEGRCAPDSTRCPTGPFEVDAQFTDDRRTITFTFQVPTFQEGPAIDVDELIYRAQTLFRPDPNSPAVETVTFPPTGEFLPFNTQEGDPFAPPAQQEDPASGERPAEERGRTGAGTAGSPEATSTSAGGGGIPAWVWVLVAVGGLAGVTGALWFLRPHPGSRPPSVAGIQAGLAGAVLALDQMSETGRVPSTHDWNREVAIPVRNAAVDAQTLAGAAGGADPALNHLAEAATRAAEDLDVKVPPGRRSRKRRREPRPGEEYSEFDTPAVPIDAATADWRRSNAGVDSGESITNMSAFSYGSDLTDSLRVKRQEDESEEMRELIAKGEALKEAQRAAEAAEPVESVDPLESIRFDEEIL